MIYFSLQTLWCRGDGRVLEETSAGTTRRGGWSLQTRVAKAVAVTLNNTPIGGRKRHYYHDDLWNIKYPSKFQWTQPH